MRPALVLTLILALTACEDSGTGGKMPTCSPPGVTNAAGLLHGYPCTQGADCKYGACDMQSITTGGAFGVCTKYECLCGAAAECRLDQVAGSTPNFMCISPTGGVPRCVRECTSVAQCTAIDARYNACTNTPPNHKYGSIGVRKFCVVNP